MTDGTTRTPSWVYPLVAAGLGLCMFGLLVFSASSRSVTTDEPLHLVRGLSWVWAPDLRLMYAHPPLANLLQGLPSALRDGPVDFEAFRGWKVANAFSVGSSYFGSDHARSLAQLASARMVTAGWTVALGLCLWSWARRTYDEHTAVFALACFVFHPTLLAHGRLATTDMPATASCFVVLICLVEYVRRPGWWPWAGFALAGGILCTVKLSGGPVMVVASAIAFVFAWRGSGHFVDAKRSRRLLRWLVEIFLAAAVAILAINLAYGFQHTGMTVQAILEYPEPHSWVSAKWKYELLAEGGFLGIQHLPRGLPIPVPFEYLAGLSTVAAQNARGHGHYFFGLRQSAGHPLYFPVMVLIKTPLGILGLLGMGLAQVMRRRKASETTWILLGFALVYLGLSCRSRINIGVRHVLPIFPVMVVLAGRAAARAWNGEAKVQKTVAAGLLVASCVAGIAAFPHYLGYFNLAVGGPRGGLAISTIGEDWGQDTRDLATEAKRDGLEPLYYDHRFKMRRSEMRHQGIHSLGLRCKAAPEGPGWVAIHVDEYFKKRAKCWRFLDDRPPDRTVNHRIWLWRLK